MLASKWSTERVWPSSGNTKALSSFMFVLLLTLEGDTVCFANEKEDDGDLKF